MKEHIINQHRIRKEAITANNGYKVYWYDQNNDFHYATIGYKEGSEESLDAGELQEYDGVVELLKGAKQTIEQNGCNL